MYSTCGYKSRLLYFIHKIQRLHISPYLLQAPLNMAVNNLLMTSNTNANTHTHDKDNPKPVSCCIHQQARRNDSFTYIGDFYCSYCVKSYLRPLIE